MNEKGNAARDWLGKKVACGNAAKHTSQPTGYVAWHECAEKKAQTHDQAQCPECGLWTIWKRRRLAPSGGRQA